jgi:hypothetical protein
MKKCTTFFGGKFKDFTGLLVNSRIFAGAIVAPSPELDVVVKGITKPVEFIDCHEIYKCPLFVNLGFSCFFSLNSTNK